MLLVVRENAGQTTTGSLHLSIMQLAVEYSYGLIVISVVISIMSAYAAFSLAERIDSAETPQLRRLWLLGGSCAMGAGIWSMHFLGMLAAHLPTTVYYFLPIVLFSLLMAICASAVTLVVVSGKELQWKRLLAAGILMGAGIGAMHYTGMAAMRMSAMHHYTPWVVALSIVVAVTFSWMALWVGFTVSQQKLSERMRLLGGTVMGLGIAAMHYVAMTGITYTPETMAPANIWTLRGTTLGGTGVAVMTMFILVAALGTAGLDKKRYFDLKENQAALLEAQRRLAEANESLQELSTRDGLTGLYNRRHFDAMFDVEWKRAVRMKKPLGLIMLDVDHFKRLNDNYGHQRGDDCLQRLARALEQRPQRGHDLVARYGGEEFIVLLPEADEFGAQEIAEAIRRDVLALQIENASSPTLWVTVSVGVCCRRPRAEHDPEAMLRDVDTALYTAKRLGRNRVEVAKKAGDSVSQLPGAAHPKAAV